MAQPRWPALGLGLLLFTLPGAWAGPLSQAQLVQLALEHNPRIRATHQAWKAAQARVWPARLPPDPELSFEYEALPGALDLGEYGERSIGVSQTLEFPVRPFLRGRLAAEAARAARLEYEAVRAAVAAEVERAGAQVWAGQHRLDYAGESLRLAVEFRDRTRVRVEAGDASRAELLRAEVEVGRTEVELAAAQEQLGHARAALNTLLSLEPDAAVELSEPPPYTPVALDLGDAQRRALAQRPDLQAFGARTAGTQAAQRLATCALLPDLNLGLASQKIRGEGDYWKAGLSLNLPLWAWGKERGEIAAARAEVARAGMEERAARNQVLLEVQGALLKVDMAQRQFLFYRDRVLPNAEEAYRFVRRRYDEGGASYLEVIDAGRTLAEVRRDWAGILLDCHTALAELARATGGNLQEKNEEESQ